MTTGGIGVLRGVECSMLCGVCCSVKGKDGETYNCAPRGVVQALCHERSELVCIQRHLAQSLRCELSEDVRLQRHQTQSPVTESAEPAYGTSRAISLLGLFTHLGSLTFRNANHFLLCNHHTTTQNGCKQLCSGRTQTTAGLFERAPDLLGPLGSGKHNTLLIVSAR